MTLGLWTTWLLKLLAACAAVWISHDVLLHIVLVGILWFCWLTSSLNNGFILTESHCHPTNSWKQLPLGTRSHQKISYMWVELGILKSHIVCQLCVKCVIWCCSWTWYGGVVTVMSFSSWSSDGPRWQGLVNCGCRLKIQSSHRTCTRQFSSELLCCISCLLF